MGEMLARFFSWLLQVPGPGADAVQLYQHRVKMASLLTGVGTMALLQWCLLLGIGIPSIFSGLIPIKPNDLKSVSAQWSTQVQDLNQKLQRNADQTETNIRQMQENLEANNEWRASQLQTQMNDTKARLCHTKTDEGRRMYADQLTHMGNQYRKLTNQTYSVPGCGDL